MRFAVPVGSTWSVLQPLFDLNRIEHRANCYHHGARIGRAGDRIRFHLAKSQRVKYWEIIANNLKKAGWSLGWVSAIDAQGRTIWIVDAHGYGKCFIVHADGNADCVLQLEAAIRAGMVPTSSITRITAHVGRGLVY